MEKLNRRQFIKRTLSTAGVCAGANLLSAPDLLSAPIQTVYREKTDPSRKIGSLPRKREVTYTEGKYYRPTGPHIPTGSFSVDCFHESTYSRASAV